MSDTTYNRPDFCLANRLKAIFNDDPEVDVEYIASSEVVPSKVILKVNNRIKASAIRRILPERYNTGLPLEVEVNDTSNMSGDVIVDAFKGNPHFKDYIELVNQITLQEFHVCIFKEEVIKFPNDNGGSLNGYEFRLMEDLARELIDIPTLSFTTDDGLPYPEDVKSAMADQ